MLNGNKLVLILPLFLMAFLFFGGYYYLQQTAAITNEDLYKEITFDIEWDRSGDEYSIYITWDWTAMPTDGLAGDDFVGISLTNEDTVEVVDHELFLLHGDDVIYETAGVNVENGVIFSFPNALDENMSYGNLGHIYIKVAAGAEPLDEAIVSYLHTWKEHGGLVEDDARFFQPRFEDDVTDLFYWVVDQVIDFS